MTSTESSFLIGGRLVPIKREGNVVYARPLQRGEEDTGETVHLKAGDRLVIPEGELVIDSRDIDEYHNPKGLGGYRPVANTVWTWSQIATEQLGFFLFFFALARRTDATHGLWASAIQAREKAKSEEGITQRLGYFNALAEAEVAVIALDRCYLMIHGKNGLIEKYCPELKIPDSIKNTRETVHEMRNAFEHIDERATGDIGGGRKDPEALTIFHQPDFVESSILRYKDYELNFETDVITTLIDCRELIMDAINERSRQKRESL